MINAGFANNCGIQLFTIGWVECPSAITPVPSTDGGGRGTGPIGRRARAGYEGAGLDALEETRRKRILIEDDDIVALIMAMLENRLM